MVGFVVKVLTSFYDRFWCGGKYVPLWYWGVNGLTRSPRSVRVRKLVNNNATKEVPDDIGQKNSQGRGRQRTKTNNRTGHIAGRNNCLPAEHGAFTKEAS